MDAAVYPAAWAGRHGQLRPKCRGACEKKNAAHFLGARWRASRKITGRPSRLSSVHSHVAVGPVSRPIRTTLGAFDLTNAAIASGSESTTPSRTTDPSWFTTQIDVCFNDTSSPI